MSLSLKNQMQGIVPDETIGFRLSRDDYELVCEEMERRGLTKSQFFRMLLAGYFSYRSLAIDNLNDVNNAKTPVG